MGVAEQVEEQVGDHPAATPGGALQGIVVEVGDHPGDAVVGLRQRGVLPDERHAVQRRTTGLLRHPDPETTGRNPRGRWR
ncbi:hypothetical protein [Micromonospora sp.]|uniref:hypothetical protein n=1 Tax=Micromonospora sp. TaxID=1876 RepID=UPI003B3B4B51